MLKQNIIIVGVSFLLVGCLSSNAQQITEIDPKDIIHLENKYDTHDLELQSANMVQSLLGEKVITNRPRPPRIMLGRLEIDNNVDEYIDVRLIQETIQGNLINSDRADFVDNKNIKVLEQQIDYQNESKYIDKQCQLIPIKKKAR